MTYRELIDETAVLGHFERRIAFGHDADLMQVRAEFDGEMLRVRIPRRLPCWSSSRIAYSAACRI